MSVALILRSKTEEYLSVTLYENDNKNEAIKHMFASNNIIKRFGLSDEFEIVIVSYLSDLDMVHKDIISYLTEEDQPLSLARSVYSVIQSTPLSEESFFRLWMNAEEKDWKKAMLTDAMANADFAHKMRTFLSIFLEPSAAQWAIFEKIP